jgi:hypothetical protein
MITNTFKVWIDFDWIFVEDIQLDDLTIWDFEWDKIYVNRIEKAKILKPSKELLKLMENDWYIITGRKQHLSKLTFQQLDKSIPSKYLNTFKWLVCNDTNYEVHTHKIEKSIALWVNLFIESDKYQSEEINKYVNCKYYEN